MTEIDNDKLSRSQIIANLISKKYSIDDQIALLRQKDEKPEEYNAFYEYAEEIKKSVPL